MRFGFAALVLMLCTVVAGTAIANAPAKSLRPDLRPGSTAFAVLAALATSSGELRVSPLPRLRPTPDTRPERVFLASAGTAVQISLRPGVRPGNLPRRTAVVQAAVRTQPLTTITSGRQGKVCGDASIIGQKLSPIAGRLSGCGVAKPVRITSVDGVTLSRPATLNCDSATALNRWVKKTVKPAVGRLGGGVESLQVIAHYSCRTRNNQPGAKISEHGRGNAIDIAAINLKNGTSLTVLKGWKDPVQGKVLKAAHKGACGPFGTVLGPNSDGFHQDHIHLDVARHRGGSYCR